MTHKQPSSAAEGRVPKSAKWKWSTLGAVCSKPQYGWTTGAAATGNLKLLRTTDITSGQIDWDNVPFCREEPPEYGKYTLDQDDIVVSRAGSVGVSHLLRNPEKAVFASYLIRFRAGESAPISPTPISSPPKL